MSSDVAIIGSILLLVMVLGLVALVRTRRQVTTPTERAVHMALHTASLAEAFHQMAEQAPAAGRVLVVAAGAGVTAGAALYLVPPRS